MTAPRAPRLLTEAEAAAYLALPAATVRREGWGRVRLGVHVRYDVRALDAKLDELAGLTSKSPASAAPEAANDPEAAFDRFSAGDPDASRRP